VPTAVIAPMMTTEMSAAMNPKRSGWQRRSHPRCRIDGSAHDLVARSAERHAPIQVHPGVAEFVSISNQDGSDGEQRTDARRAYEETIGQSPVPGASKLWEGLHHRWAKVLGSLSDAARRGLSPEDIGKARRQRTGDSLRSMP
jgi:hypothetical protein